MASCKQLEDYEHAMLDRSVKIEPIVDGWSAWPHLLAPAQQAFNLAFRYLPVARSFIASPMVHVAATTDESMFGGPFLDLPLEAVDDVRRYVSETESRRAEALAFAGQFREFDRKLQEMNGFCLDSIREDAPDALRGLVELAYDLNNHPKMRILEEMMEEADLGFRSAQQLLLHRDREIDRSFFLSALRLQVDGGLHLQAEFGSDVAKMLYSARRLQINLFDLAAALGVSIEAVSPYFTNGDPPTPDRYAGQGVRIRYFGHAALLIESAGAAILVDPTFAREPQPGCHHFTLDDLPDHIDVLFLSHGHQDHLCPEVVMELRDRIGLVVIPPPNRGCPADPSLRRMLARLGFDRIVTLEPLERLAINDGAIIALPFSGEHSDLDVHSKQCALIEMQGRRICLFVDSDAVDFDVYRRIGARLREPDVMFIGMECFGAPLSWLYGPLISSVITKRNDNSRRLSGANYGRAWRLAEELKPQRAFVYAMGQEPWMRRLMGLNYRPDSVQLLESQSFIDRCLANGIPAQRLHMHMELVL